MLDLNEVAQFGGVSHLIITTRCDPSICRDLIPGGNVIFGDGLSRRCIAHDLVASTAAVPAEQGAAAAVGFPRRPVTIPTTGAAAAANGDPRHRRRLRRPRDSGSLRRDSAGHRRCRDRRPPPALIPPTVDRSGGIDVPSTPGACVFPDRQLVIRRKCTPSPTLGPDAFSGIAPVVSSASQAGLRRKDPTLWGRRHERRKSTTSRRWHTIVCAAHGCFGDHISDVIL